MHNEDANERSPSPISRMESVEWKGIVGGLRWCAFFAGGGGCVVFEEGLDLAIPVGREFLMC